MIVSAMGTGSWPWTTMLQKRHPPPLPNWVKNGNVGVVGIYWGGTQYREALPALLIKSKPVTPVYEKANGPMPSVSFQPGYKSVVLFVVCEKCCGPLCNRRAPGPIGGLCNVGFPRTLEKQLCQLWELVKKGEASTRAAALLVQNKAEYSLYSTRRATKNPPFLIGVPPVTAGATVLNKIGLRLEMVSNVGLSTV